MEKNEIQEQFTCVKCSSVCMIKIVQSVICPVCMGRVFRKTRTEKIITFEKIC